MCRLGDKRGATKAAAATMVQDVIAAAAALLRTEFCLGPSPTEPPPKGDWGVTRYVDMLPSMGEHEHTAPGHQLIVPGIRGQVHQRLIAI
ncbi:unnamed protein product [Heligmosomoides polygyrus]|uniref:Uncharacterized protein n=1 Tax=Heligmosomoides polygyrus TaxID=6339 RepID=A0A183GBH2_HELPZ|nr:unnamed protein product [Heligmosomoides polygyrus]